MNFSSDQAQDETGIELTPLIDVVFLLLIFFMISTTFNKETALSINLPEANGEPGVTQPSTIEVQIGAASEYAIVSGDLEKPRTLINSDRQTLLRALAKLNSDESVILIIRADQKAPHESVIRVLDVAQELGMSNITFATAQLQD